MRGPVQAAVIKGAIWPLAVPSFPFHLATRVKGVLKGQLQVGIRKSRKGHIGSSVELDFLLLLNHGGPWISSLNAGEQDGVG